jgi:hypothetical protein
MRVSKAVLLALVAMAVLLTYRGNIMADVLFQDDFEQDAIGDEPAKWDYSLDAEITDVGQVVPDPLEPDNQVFTDYGGYLADNGAEYTDFVAEWDWMFYLDDARNNSMGFRVQGPDGNYQLSRRGGGLDWNLYLFDGAWILLDSYVFETEIDTWYRVQLSVMGEDFIVKAKEKGDDTPFADLDPILDVTDDTFESGFFSTSYYGPIDNVIIADTEQDIIDASTGGTPQLQAGDADRDFDFDQLDLVQVQISGKYLTRQPATWGEGDWNGAPGGTQQAPPAGDAVFDQLDIIAALAAGTYLTGPYAALTPGGDFKDGPPSIVNLADTGQVGLNLVPIPEPGALPLLCVGLVGLLLRRRRCHQGAGTVA